jgi:hypothetical protein
MNDTQASLISAHLNAITTFAKLAVNSALLLNGAPVVAVLSGSVQGVYALDILKYCSIGALSAALCSATCYISQKMYMCGDIEYLVQGKSCRRKHIATRIFLALAGALLLLSLACPVLLYMKKFHMLWSQ